MQRVCNAKCNAGLILTIKNLTLSHLSSNEKERGHGMTEDQAERLVKAIESLAVGVRILATGEQGCESPVQTIARPRKSRAERGQLKRKRKKGHGDESHQTGESHTSRCIFAAT